MSNKKKWKWKRVVYLLCIQNKSITLFFGSKGIKNDRQCGINKAVQNLEKMDIAPACE